MVSYSGLGIALCESTVVRESCCETLTMSESRHVKHDDSNTYSNNNDNDSNRHSNSNSNRNTSNDNVIRSSDNNDTNDTTPGLHHKISVFSDPDPGKS